MFQPSLTEDLSLTLEEMPGSVSTPLMMDIHVDGDAWQCVPIPDDGKCTQIDSNTQQRVIAPTDGGVAFDNGR